MGKGAWRAQVDWPTYVSTDVRCDLLFEFYSYLRSGSAAYAWPALT
jgi:hypothetical protein